MNETEEFRVKMHSFDAALGNNNYLMVLKIKFYVTTVLFLIGTIGNFIILKVMNDENFSTRPRRILCSFLAITDLLLLVLFLIISIIVLYSEAVYNIHQILCKLYNPIIYFVCHINAWMLIFLTFERLVAVFLPFNIHDIFSAARVKGTIIIFTIISLIWNAEPAYRYELIKMGNHSVCISVNDYDLTNIMYYKDLTSEFLVSVVPILIIIPSNIALMIKMYKNRKRRQQLGVNIGRGPNNSLKFNAMIISVTTAFVIFYLPYTLYMFITNYDLSGISDEILLMINTCNPAVNCYLYFLSADLFKQKVINDMKKMFNRCTNAN